MKRSCFLVILFFASCSLADAKRAEELTLLELQRALVAKRFVDLTHTLSLREFRIGQVFPMRSAR